MIGNNASFAYNIIIIIIILLLLLLLFIYLNKQITSPLAHLRPSFNQNQLALIKTSLA